MKVAIPLWQGRVSPVFDEASRILIVDISNGEEKSRQEESLLTRNPFKRAQALPRLGVDLLICGMISQTQQTALDSVGIQIIPHICGHMEDVIAIALHAPTFVKDEQEVLPVSMKQEKARKVITPKAITNQVGVHH